MLLRLSNTPRDYAWGSATLLAELEGREPTGAPEAEVWFGDHPGDPADLLDGSTLDAVTGGGLPYLLKLLAAGAPLSIQVHPTLAQAREGRHREEHLAADDPQRNYRDDNHKPELIVAVTDRFEALAGLRPITDTLRLLDALGSSAGVARLRAVLTAVPDDAGVLRDAVEWALSTAAQSEIDDIIAAVTDASSEEFAAEISVVRGIAEQNPRDRGIVVALLMNLIVLGRGQGIFLRAGMLHAYVSGLGVEIMAASDNVLRGGLTSKHVDVPELLAVLDAEPDTVPVLFPAAAGLVTSYSVDVPDFSLRRIELVGESVRVPIHGPAMVLATAGAVAVAGEATHEEQPIGIGTAVFASTDETGLTLRGAGEVFIAQPGR
ncbi:mannose-6-phosphate isomerase, class I [Microbacterium sp. GXF6406]